MQTRIDGDEPKRRKLPDELASVVAFEALEPHLTTLHDSCAHGNRKLHHDDLLIAYLLAFYNATIRSLRTIELLAYDPRFAHHFEGSTLKRSAFSDAGKTFDTQLLEPLIQQLYAQAPDLRHTDPKLRLLIEKLRIFDGSMFNVASDVAWAIAHRTRDGKKHRRVRIDFCLRVIDDTVASLIVSGNRRGSEAASFIDQLQPGLIYIVDRNFVHFGFLNAVLAAPADFVLRARDNAPAVKVLQDRDLQPEDHAAGIIADQLVQLTGSSGATDAPSQTLRQITLIDEHGRTLILLTSVLDLSAAMIAQLYRWRWQIELFFRWLKTFAGMDHLISHSRNGITLQFYVAVIGMLLIYIKTGRKPDKYSLILLQQVAQGASMEHLLPWLQLRWKEKDRAAARRAEKAAAKKA
jgi:Transposase DDE domain